MNTKNNSRQRVFTFIERYRATNGVSPSFSEIASALGFKSVDTVTFHVKKLVSEGLLKNLNGKARGLVPSVRHGIPIVNIIRVDRSDLLPETDWKYFVVDDGMFRKGRADWLVVIPNHALLEEDLIAGELVAVKKTKSFTAGHLICVSHGDEIHLGYGHVHDGVNHIHLDRDDKPGQQIHIPEGDEPIDDETKWRFWGIVIGVIRRSIRVKPDFAREQAESKIAARITAKTTK